VIGLKVQDLKKGFQEDVQKLQELRKKKAVQNKSFAADDQDDE